MRFSRLVFVCALVACGNSKSNNGVDAPKQFEDAKVFMDAPPGLMGLGQKCGMGLPACPANAPDCIGLALGNGMNSTQFCTPACDMNATAKTNATGQFPANGFTPPPSNMACSSAFTGTAGTPLCGVLLAYTPMDTPPKPNKTYTGISLGCVVACGMGNACPTSMTCNTTVMLCFPS
jgi:hypothetical protein